MGKLIAQAIAAITGLAIWDGFVGSVVWNWFMPKTFNLPTITIAQAIGVCLVVEVISGVSTKLLDDDDLVEALVIHAALGVMALIIGFFTQLFI